MTKRAPRPTSKGTAKRTPKPDDYALDTAAADRKLPAPDLPYRPRDPKRYRPRIALIGCGGITASHLKAYKRAGYHVAALCDINLDAAKARRAEFYPDADVCTDYRQVLARPDIDVVDLATHPEHRAPLLEAAIKAGKHVLSQKPFVLDLPFGRKLVELARRHAVRVAVNQNGRWAPHFSYMRQAVKAKMIGDVSAVDLSVHWDHNWVRGTPFDRIRHLVLYDFAIHWFDILTCFMGERVPTRVYAAMSRSSSQKATPPLLAHVVVEYDAAQASLVFRADTTHQPQDRTVVVGSQGTLVSQGPSLNRQKVTLQTDQGVAVPRLRGEWFSNGFHGTMAELLCAIEENREPDHSAAHNLRSLELCFAAIASAESGRPETPGRIRRLNPAWHHL